MKNTSKNKLFTTPDHSYSKQYEDEELPNPMVDSFFSQKSQNTFKSNSSPPKNIKLILKSDKKNQYIKPQQYQITRDGLDIKTKIEKKYQQLDCLNPLIKLVQVNEKQRKTECFNGEEATIDQRIYFNQCHEIRNIYYMTAIGYKLGIEEVEDGQEIQAENNINISEKLLKSMRVKKQLQRAKNKITKIKVVSEISNKEFPDEVKRLKKDREHSDHINQLLNDPNAIVKSNHQLGELINQTKVINTNQTIEQQIYQQPKVIEVKKKDKVNIYITKSIIIHIFCTTGVVLLVLISAYFKTINGFTIQVEDL